MISCVIINWWAGKPGTLWKTYSKHVPLPTYKSENVSSILVERYLLSLFLIWRTDLPAHFFCGDSPSVDASDFCDKLLPSQSVPCPNSLLKPFRLPQDRTPFSRPDWSVSSSSSFASSWFSLWEESLLSKCSALLLDNPSSSSLGAWLSFLERPSPKLEAKNSPYSSLSSDLYFERISNLSASSFFRNWISASRRSSSSEIWQEQEAK